MKAFLVVITLLIGCLFYNQFKENSLVFNGDSMGYYLYLPATFIYHNHYNLNAFPTDKGIDTRLHDYTAYMTQHMMSPKGYIVNQYTYGVALMEAPFFLAAHAIERLTGGQADGFTGWYPIAIRWSSLFYTLLGLLLTFKILRRWFSPSISFYTILLIAIGTNLFWFTTYQPGMVHNILFMLLALLIWWTIKLYETDKLKYFLGVGFCVGLICVIRPSDLIYAIFPILYAPAGWPTIKEKWVWFQHHWNKVIIAVIVAALPVIPQLVYWKLLSGHWVYDGYGDQQTFNFLKPALFKGLLSPWNGWLFYSPIMVFSVIGLFFINRIKPFKWALLVILPIYVWVIYSWYLPNYINGLGSRPMVNIYALLALPMAVSIQKIADLKSWKRLAAILVVVFFVFTNLNFSYRKAAGMIYTDYSNFTFVRRTFFKSKLNAGDLVVQDITHNQPLPEETIPVGEQITSTIDSNLLQKEGEQWFYNVKPFEQYPPLGITTQWTNKWNVAKWAYCEGDFRMNSNTGQIFEDVVLIFEVKRGDAYLTWQAIRLVNKIGRTNFDINMFWNDHKGFGKAGFYAWIPKHKIQEGDIINVRVENAYNNNIDVGQLRLQFCKPK